MSILNKSILLSVLLLPTTQVIADQQKEMIDFLQNPTARNAQIQHQAISEEMSVEDQSKVMIAQLNTPYLESDFKRLVRSEQMSSASRVGAKANDAQYVMIRNLLTTRLR